jgi:glycosyltransferase involved in cell wall biosynthesis
LRKVIHLIPYDAIGGVEIAARTMSNVSSPDIDFRVEYIFSNVSTHGDRYRALSVLPFFRSAVRIARENPDLLIVSLWRASIVALLVKLVRPRLRLILMLHNVSDVHWLDRIFTSLAARSALQLWGDSKETVTRRAPQVRTVVRRVISFVTKQLDPLPARPVRPHFIFWGRITSQKALARAIRIFSAVYSRLPEARFTVIGPDGGDLANMQSYVTDLGLKDAVSFPGILTLEQIIPLASNASFYLQTSLWEGMGMSVTEAMQLGLVPVVTPVGEIGRYCRNGSNALVIESDAAAADSVIELVHDDARYQEIRNGALRTWTSSPLYSESMLQACREALYDTTVKEVARGAS